MLYHASLLHRYLLYCLYFSMFEFCSPTLSPLITCRSNLRLSLSLSSRRTSTMADVEGEVAAAAGAAPKKRTFRKFSYRGIDLDALLDMSTEELVKLFPARIRRRLSRGLKRKPMALIKKLRKAKREAPPGEKPEPVRTHLRNMIIVPEMIGSIIGVYNGKTFNQVEIKPEMIAHYLAEFSISYKPVKHGRPGIGATHSSRFIPLKWRGHITFSQLIELSRSRFFVLMCHHLLF